MDDSAFDKVAKDDLAHIIIVFVDGVLNLILCRAVYLGRRCWMCCGVIKYCCWVDMSVGGCGRDESEVALVTSFEAAWDRSAIGADFFL